MLLFPLNVSKFHHYVWWQHKTFDLTLTLSQSCGSVSTKMTDPRNIFSLRSLQQLFLPQHSSEHHPKIQSCIRISTCCYGNRHPAFPARLVWPELVVPFNKKKNPSHTAAFRTEMPLGTVKCSCWKELQWVSHQLRLAALSNQAQSTGLIRNTMPH